MARYHLILLATLFYYVTFIYATATVETPGSGGTIATGVTISITYHVVGTPAVKVTLKAQDQATKNEISISDDLPAALTTFSWMVNVPPATYALEINDGTGNAFSGPFTIVAGTLPVTTGPPAVTSSPPAATTSPPATSSPKSQAAATSSGAATTSSGSAATATTSKSSAPTSFSGYSLLVSLAVVAAVMFHLA